MRALSVLDKRWLRGAILCMVVLFASESCQAKRKTTNGRFTAGRQALRRGDYKRAIEMLDAYLRCKPQGRLASRASFLIAKAHVGLGDYDAARRQFELTIQKFPTSDEAHKSQYKLAFLSLIQGDVPDARKRFQALVDRPSGTLVPEAAAMLRFLDKQMAAGKDNKPLPKGKE